MSQTHSRNSSIASMTTNARGFENDTVLLTPMRFLIKYCPRAAASKMIQPIVQLSILYLLFYQHGIEIACIVAISEPFFEVFGQTITNSVMRGAKTLCEERMALSQLGAARMIGNYGIALSVGLCLIPCILMAIFANLLDIFFDVQIGYSYVLVTLITIPFSRAVLLALRPLFQISHQDISEFVIYLVTNLLHLLCIYLLNFISEVVGGSKSSIMGSLAAFQCIVNLIGTFGGVAVFLRNDTMFRIHPKFYRPFHWTVVGKILTLGFGRLFEFGGEQFVTILILYRYASIKSFGDTYSKYQMFTFVIHRMIFQITGSVSIGASTQISELFKILKSYPNKVLNFVRITIMVLLLFQVLVCIVVYVLFKGFSEQFFSSRVKVESKDILSQLVVDIPLGAFLGLVQVLISIGQAMNDALKCKKVIGFNNVVFLVSSCVFGGLLFYRDDADLQFIYDIYIVSLGIAGACVMTYYYSTVTISSSTNTFESLMARVNETADEMDFQINDNGEDNDDTLEMDMSLEALDFPDTFFDREEAMKVQKTGAIEANILSQQIGSSAGLVASSDDMQKKYLPDSDPNSATTGNLGGDQADVVNAPKVMEENTQRESNFYSAQNPDSSKLL